MIERIIPIVAIVRFEGAPSEDAEDEAQDSGDIAADREDRDGNADDAEDQPRNGKTAALLRLRHWRPGIGVLLRLLVSALWRIVALRLLRRIPALRRIVAALLLRRIPARWILRIIGWLTIRWLVAQDFLAFPCSSKFDTPVKQDRPLAPVYHTGTNMNSPGAFYAATPLLA